MAGTKFVFDTVTPLTVASFVHRQSRQPLTATSSNFSKMLTAPVCRMIYSACFLFAFLTTTCRLASVARPIQVMSLSVPSLVGVGVGGVSTTPTDEAGSLQRGDIISHINGERVRAFWSSAAAIIAVSHLRISIKVLAASWRLYQTQVKVGRSKGWPRTTRCIILQRNILSCRPRHQTQQAIAL